MDNKKLEKLQNILQMVDNQASFDELVKIVGSVVKLFTQMKGEIEKNQQFLDSFAGKLEQSVQKRLSQLKDGYTPVKGKDYFDGKPGEPGTDADEEKIVQEVLSQIPEGDPLTPELVIETINKDTDSKISRERIEGLEDELKAIRSLPRGTGGGGTSAIGVRQAFKYIAHTEQPSGLINGSNTVYTVKNTIFWVAGFTLNGEQIAELPNFTYAGNTITFSSALPASFSGKDWEIKYIG